MRLDTVGPDWFRVAERGGLIIGFLISCPTNKTPDEFKSCEDATNHGTLRGTYNREGPNVYGVSLSMLPGAGEGVRNMLRCHTMGKIIEAGHQQIYFESRLPGLLAWVRRQCRNEGRDVDSLTDEERLGFAELYFRSTKMVRGKSVPMDPLLRIYAQFGCRFLRVLPNAYEDTRSMNFGAIAVWDNPLPRILRRNLLIRKAVGRILCLLSRSHRLMSATAP